MSTEMSPHQITGMEHQQSLPSFNHRVVTLWNDVKNLREIPTSQDGDAFVDDASKRHQADLSQFLSEHRQKNSEYYTDPNYYRLVFMETALPALVNFSREKSIGKDRLHNYQQSLQKGAVSAGREMLAAFDKGVWSTQANNIIGVMNEITPIGVYSRGDTVVTLATHEEDMKEKTDLIASRINRFGMVSWRQNIQAKTNINPHNPIPNVALLDAKDFGNRSNGKDILHDQEITRLLIEEEDGVIMPSDKSYLLTLHENFWPLVHYRLSRDFYVHHTEQAQKARNNLFSMQKISKHALKRTAAVQSLSTDFLTTGTADRT